MPSRKASRSRTPNEPPADRQCTATAKRTGKRCGAYAILGGNVCRLHGGSAPQVKAAAARRLLVADLLEKAAYYGDTRELDPATALEEELWRTAGHVGWLQQLVGAQTAAEPFDSRETYELYQSERKHLFEVSKACLSIGIEERRVRVSEVLAERIATFGRALLEEMGIDPRTERARVAFRKHLTLVAGGQSS